MPHSTAQQPNQITQSYVLNEMIRFRRGKQNVINKFLVKAHNAQKSYRIDRMINQ